MGGAVTPVSRTPAEYAVLFLQQAAQSGSTVLIPGAWHPRAVRPAGRPRGGAEPRTTLHVQPAMMPNRERLEREREGGGALKERARGHRANFLTRLWRRTPLHAPEIAVLGSRAVPQPR